MVCTLSDDEGPDNDADMGRFRIMVENKELYFWQGTEVTTGRGYVWPVNRDVLLETRGSGGVQITCEADEMDNTGVEKRWGAASLPIPQQGSGPKKM